MGYRTRIEETALGVKALNIEGKYVYVCETEIQEVKEYDESNNRR